jgi:hypothetical protein
MITQIESNLQEVKGRPSIKWMLISPFEFREVNMRSRSHISNRQLHTHTKMIPTGKTQGEPSWVGAPFPRDLTRTAPPSRPWHPRWPTSMVDPAKSQLGELIPSTQA